MLFETPSAEVRSYTIYSPWRGRENVRMLLHARAKSTAQLGSALFRRLHTLLKFLARFVWPFSLFCIHLWRFLSHYGNMNGTWKWQNVTASSCEKHSSVGFGPFPQTAYISHSRIGHYFYSKLYGHTPRSASALQWCQKNWKVTRVTTLICFCFNM